MTFPNLILLYINPRILSDCASCQRPGDKLTHIFLVFQSLEALLASKYSDEYVTLKCNPEGP